jgi:hypothetical protein
MIGTLPGISLSGWPIGTDMNMIWVSNWKVWDLGKWKSHPLALLGIHTRIQGFPLPKQSNLLIQCLTKVIQMIRDVRYASLLECLAITPLLSALQTLTILTPSPILLEPE